MICQKCGGRMVAGTGTAASALVWLSLILGGIAVGIGLGWFSSITLGVVISGPLVLGGLFLKLRGAQDVWRCTSCGRVENRY